MREWVVPGFTEVRELGSGGFGDVVLAREDASGTLVAVKYLHGELLADPGFAAMFRGEARVLASLDDPNVVRLYEYVESPDGAAIVMELIDGVSLRGILDREGKTSAEAALVVLQGSLLGLAAAHARGVVHRDYKPANVLVDGAGASKLTDFGIAVRAGDRPVPAGTLAYAPPEQFQGRAATPAGDVYAATATFYECLAGRPPFSGETPEALLSQHGSAAVPLEAVPQALRPLIAAGMAKDPKDRPKDAAALVAELLAVAPFFYGQDWQERGRSHLGEAALLLAALWPSSTAPAVQGQTIEQVRLNHPTQQAQQPAHAEQANQAGHAEHAGHVRHLEHLEHEHVEHVEHVAHLEHVEQAAHAGQSASSATSSSASAAEGAGPSNATAGTSASSTPPPRGSSSATRASRLGRYTRNVLSAGHGAGAIAAVAVVAALATGIALAASGGSAGRGPASGGPAGGAAASARPSSSAASGGSGGGPVPGSIPIAATSSSAAVTGDVFVTYLGQGSNSPNARISGEISNATSGEVARLYAQQFPYAGAPAPVASLTLQPAGGTAAYAFQVAPTLATRYETELFKNSTATKPLALSTATTIYVVYHGTNTDTKSCNGTTCTYTYSYIETVPPSALAAEMSKQWYTYFAVDLSSSGQPATPATMQLGAGDPVVGAAQQVSADEFSRTVTFTFTTNGDGYDFVSEWCDKDTEAQDGVGLPGSHGCGSDSSVPHGVAYLG
jgi:serine/threonine protein kinase